MTRARLWTLGILLVLPLLLVPVLARGQTISVLPGAGPADGNPTWPRDTSGAAAAQCSFLGRSGMATLCSERDPLPIGNLGTTNSTTDPDRAGNYFNFGLFTGTVGAQKAVPVLVTPYALYSFAQTDGGGTQGFDVFFSRTAGQSSTLVARVTTPTNFTGGAGAVLKSRAGEFLVGGSTAAVTPGATALMRWLGTATATQIALPGLPAGLTGRILSLAQQAQAAPSPQATILALYVTGANAAYVCRSADSGTTFTCAGTSVATVSVNRSATLLTSPEAGVWLLATSTGILRNEADGVGGWGFVTGGAAPMTGLTCLSTTVCLAIQNNVQIVRSVDGGRTWSAGANLAAGPSTHRALASLGSGVAVTLPGTGGSVIYRTADYGATWGAIPDPDATLALDLNGSVSTLPGYVAYSSELVGAGEKIVVSTPLSTVSSTLPSTVVPLATAPAQRGTLLNASTTSAANTAIALTVAGAQTESVHIYGITAFCSAGSATLSFDIGGLTKWGTSAGQIGTSTFAVAWPVGYTFSAGANAFVRLTSCGVGNTGTVYLEADRY